MTYLKDLFSAKKTPQSEAIPGTAQVPNSGGGYAWAVDDWTRLQRFLILGSEGGSYYTTQRALSLENAAAVVRCLQVDGPRTVRTIVEISEAGRAPKTDPAIFALALATTANADAETRRQALAAMPRVCRTGTHLFHFAEYTNGLRGWGRGLRRAVADWYAQPADKLALQAVKYQSRDGWSHRDLLRLAHPKAADPESAHQTLYHWMVKGWEWVGDEPHPDPALRLVWAFERAKRAETKDEIVRLIREYRLPREAVPTQWLTEGDVWKALLADMPMTALLRNLATLTRVGVLDDWDQTRAIVQQLSDGNRLRKARVHPIAVLAALKTYAQGHGERGKNTWKPVQAVVDALDAAFYTTFENVPSTGKRWLLALDVSGSMDCGTVSGIPGLTPRVASAAMAMLTAATEAQHRMVAFTAAGSGFGGQWGGGDPGITPLAISPKQRLDDVCAKVRALPMGGTDCALPMLWALKQKLPVDVFVVYTDSETWAGQIHPSQALQQYRDQMGIAAKLIVVGMVSNGFTIADPNDAGMLDVVGFDTATPAVMSDFASA
jgi:60 kDa SS-A/Ro ribonucleoprotein